MYPNEARLRNMTYGMTIHFDIEIEYIVYPNESEVDITLAQPITKTFILKNIYFGRFPIMLQSDFCILSQCSTDTRFYMGECRNDHGGYFIIEGNEKVIVSQENLLIISFEPKLINLMISILIPAISAPLVKTLLNPLAS